MATGVIPLKPLLYKKKSPVAVKASDVTFTHTTENICAGGGIVNLSDIVINEVNADDFVAGKGTLVLRFTDPNIAFTGSPTVTITIAGSPSRSSISNVALTDGKIQFDYNFATQTTRTDIEAITISGLEAQATDLVSGSASIKIAGDLGNIKGLDATSVLRTVTTTNPAAAPAIQGFNVVYDGQTVTFEVPAITGATSYQWDLNDPGGALTVSGASDQRTISYVVAYTGGASLTAGLRVRGVNGSACNGAYSEAHEISIYNPANAAVGDFEDPKVHLNIPHERVCVGVTSINVGDIVITEIANTDFVQNTQNSAGLFLDAVGFTLDETVTPNITIEINGGTIAGTNPRFRDYTTITGRLTRQFLFNYNLTGSDAGIDKITISGLRVNTTATTTATTNIRLREREEPLGLNFGNVMAKITVQDVPDGTGTITGANNMAVGETATFTVAGITGANAYQWTVPAGFVEGGNTIVTSTGSITLTANSEVASANLTVKGINTNLNPSCEGTTASHTVTVANPVSFTTPSLNICVGTEKVLGDIIITENALNGILSFNNNRTLTLSLPNTNDFEFVTTALPTITSTNGAFNITGRTFLNSGNGTNEFRFNILFPAASETTLETITIAGLRIKANAGASGTANITVGSNAVNQIRGLSAGDILATIDADPLPGAVSFDNPPTFICNDGANNTFNLTNNPAITAYEWDLPTELDTPTPISETNTIAISSVVAGTYTLRVRGKNNATGCVGPWATREVIVKDRTPEDISAVTPSGPALIRVNSTNNTYSIKPIGNVRATNGYLWEWSWIDGGGNTQTRTATTTVNTLDFDANGIQAGATVSLAVRGESDCGVSGAASAALTINVEIGGINVPTPTTLNVCAGNGPKNLDLIVLTEREPGAFQTGMGSIDFALDNTTDYTLEGTALATFSGTGASGSATISGGVLTLTYDFTATSASVINSIIISNIQVSATSDAATTNLTPTNISAGNNNEHLTGITNSTILAVVDGLASPTISTTFDTKPPSNTVCEGGMLTFGVTPVMNVNYLWTVPTNYNVTGMNGASLQTSSEITVTIGAGAQSGAIALKLENDNGDGCTSATISENIQVIPPPAAATAINGNLDMCEGTPTVYSVNPISGADVCVWTFRDGGRVVLEETTTNHFVSFDATNVFEVTDPATLGSKNITLTVFGRSTACGDGTPSTPITINVKRNNVVITNTKVDYTIRDRAETLTATANGATITDAIFTGPGVRQSFSGSFLFYPSQAGVGEHTIVCLYTDPVTQCAGRGEITFRVAGVNALGLLEKYCRDAGKDDFFVRKVLLNRFVNTNTRTIRYIHSLRALNGLEVDVSRPNNARIDNSHGAILNYDDARRSETFYYNFNPATVTGNSARIIANVVEATYIRLGSTAPYILDPGSVIRTTQDLVDDSNTPALELINIVDVPQPIIDVPLGAACADNSTEYTYSVDNHPPNTATVTTTYAWAITPAAAGEFIGGNTGQTVRVRWSTAGNHTLTLTANRDDDGTFCSNNGSASIRVEALPSFDFSATSAGAPANTSANLPDACQRSITSYAASVSSFTSYSWTATNGNIQGSSNGSTVNVEWTGTGTGTLSLTATNSSGCSQTVTGTVNILETIGFLANQRIETCKNTPGVVYQIQDPTPGTGTITWGVTGGTITASDATSATITWGNTDRGTVTVTEDIPGSCNTVQTLDVAIRDLPVVAIDVETAYCANVTTNPTLTPRVNGSTTLPSGTASYALNKLGSTDDLSGFVNASTNELDIRGLIAAGVAGGAGPGNYQIQYEFTNSGGCKGASAIIDFEITSAPDVAFSFVSKPTQGYCENGGSIRINPNITGGSFTVMLNTTTVTPTITQETNGDYSIDISTLTPSASDYTITYTRDIGNSCRATSLPQTFKILELPRISFNLPATRGCIRDGGVIDLTATVTEVGGGPITVSAPFTGATDGSSAYFEVKRPGRTSFERLTGGDFDLGNPSGAATPPTTTADWNLLAGDYEFRLVYTASTANGSCVANSVVRKLTVESLPLVDFTGLDASYCIETGRVNLTPIIDNGNTMVSSGTGQFTVYLQSSPTMPLKTLTGNSFVTSTNSSVTDGLDVGDYIIEYSFTNDKTCREVSQRKQFSIVVVQPVDFSLQSTIDKFCIDASSVGFNPDRTGGFFTIQNTTIASAPIVLNRGITSVNIDQLAVNEVDRLGTYSVTYTFEETLGGSNCTSEMIKTAVFEIVPLPKVSIVDIIPGGYCTQVTDPFQLKASINNGTIPPPTITADPNNVFFQIRRKSGKRGTTPFMKLVLPGSTTLTDVFDPRRPIPNEAPILPNASTDEWNELVGEYEVMYTYRDANLCSKTSDPVIIKINPLPKLSFTGLESTYCDDVELVTLIPFDGESRVNSNVTFKYRRLSETTFNPFEQGFAFSPKDLGAGTYEIVLESDASVCQNTSNRDGMVTVTINPTPKQVKVRAVRDYDKNTVKFEATAGNVSDQWQWNWDFRDGTSSNLQNPIKTLPNALPQIIRYNLTPSTEQGCKTSVIKDFKIDFNVEGFCLGSPTRFTNQSILTGDKIGSITWDFGDGSANITGDVVNHQYQSEGTYWVSLTITTEDNIATYVLRRRIDIFPVVTVTERQFYTEDFESGTNGWISHGVVDVNRVAIDSTSWKLKQPDGFLIRNNTGNAWITDNRDNLNRGATNANYNSNEQSYVESPCFDIGGLTKPMISFRYWSDTDKGADGVVLLYTIDDGKTWQRLGTQDLGIDWYDTTPILGEPGDASSTIDVTANLRDQGWSGRSNIVAGEWRFARYSLTEVLIKMEQLGITNRIVRFRMSFGSNDDNPPGENFDGFAFDNIVIGNRNRVVLLEYFINASIADAEAKDLAVKNFPETGNKNEVISIHYHTGFPGADALHDQNDKDPSGRSFYHGIREVPRAVVDGYFNDVVIGQWTQDYFADRTLIVSPFNIDIGQPSVSGNTLNVSAEVRALRQFDRPVVMHVVLIDSVTNSDGKVFYNVVRKMLPDAAGTYKETNWALGDTEKLNFSWNIGNLNPETFRVVVFVEDYQTKEVHQAAVTSVISNRTNENQSEHPVTAVSEDLLKSGAKLFPNPTLHKINIQLGTHYQPSAGATWEIVSVGGKTLKTGVWPSGKQLLSVDVDELANGFYVFRILDQDKSYLLRFEKQ
ncbi:MAG TPA: hypothetical protein DCS93_03340 [Microscillaceae bacterium]|nr:hypothetical protein [Microscillaceae bacterium]